MSCQTAEKARKIQELKMEMTESKRLRTLRLLKSRTDFMFILTPYILPK